MNGERNKCCIMIFAKYPKPGTVKTRLADTIGNEKAAQLYKCFVLDTIDCIKRLNLPFEIFYWPGEYGAEFPAAFGPEYVYIPQKGSDLSQRLANAFRQAFEQDFEYAIAVGSDSPDIPPVAINDAFKQLKVADAAVGLTADGGYYLIGFSKNSFTGEAFDDIPWSTTGVLPQTLSILKNLGKTVSLLPVWYDIDTIDDLRDFACRNRSGSCAAISTLSYISKEMPWLNSTVITGDSAHVRL